MKPFYSENGNYKDGRKKIMIVYNDKKTKLTLPKPEALLRTFEVLKKDPKLLRLGEGTKKCALCEP